MSKIDLNAIIEGAWEYEDGETGTEKCIRAYCRDHGIDESIAEQAVREAFKQGALEAGIPLSVVEGRSKLSDHFSPEYISDKCGRK